MIDPRDVGAAAAAVLTDAFAAGRTYVLGGLRDRCTRPLK
jgi:uncharacterized protein YbjT (DUF2867 family)